MSNNDLGQLVSELYSRLQPYENDVQAKALAAVQVLLDHPAQHGRLETTNSAFPPGHLNHGALERADNARDYFDKKQPTAKLEELAVAVRFLELSTGNEAITKGDIEDVILAARRDFDSPHFARDMNNAKFKGLFAKSRDKGVFTLSHYGQKYVDTLPNREALAQLRRPTGAKRRKGKKSQADGKRVTANPSIK